VEITQLTDENYNDFSELRTKVNELFTKVLKTDNKYHLNYKDLREIMKLANKLEIKIWESNFVLDLSKRYKVCCKLCSPELGYATFRIIKQCDTYLDAYKEVMKLTGNEFSYSQYPNLGRSNEIFILEIDF